jgi:small subunit ribosomal protein S9
MTTKNETIKKTAVKTVEKKTVAKKAPVKKVAVKKPEADVSKPIELDAKKGYIPSVGRRKKSIARVRLIKNGTGKIVINGKPYDQYFSVFDLRKQITEPLTVVGQADAVDVSVKVIGGGIRGQAEAIRQGISRSLIQLNPTFRKSLKKLGFLMRDPRKKERKKFGLKKARRAPQWSKR